MVFWLLQLFCFSCSLMHPIRAGSVDISQDEPPSGFDKRGLTNAWDPTERSTREDWEEWMRQVSAEMLKHSQSPSLRACHSLAQVVRGCQTLLRSCLKPCKDIALCMSNSPRTVHFAAYSQYVDCLVHSHGLMTRGCYHIFAVKNSSQKLMDM